MSNYIETLAQINQMQECIKAYGEFPAEIKKKLQYKFRLDWNYYSNSMEGNTLTKAETRDVMVGVLNVAGKPLKDVLEMKGHNDVVEQIMRMGKGEVRLSEKRIKDIHKGIMHEDAENKKDEIGQWKKHPNHIINYKSEKFNFAAPDEVADKVHDLLNWLNAELDKIDAGKKGAPHPLDVILKFHLEYLTIHPFQDGNGRTARILTNLLLISFDYPPLIIRKEDKDAYYNYLGDIQGYSGKPDLLFAYMGKLVLRSQQLVLDALEGKEIEEPDDVEKEIALWKKEQEGKPLTRTSELAINVFKDSIEVILESLSAKIYINFESLFKAIFLSIKINNEIVSEDYIHVRSMIDIANWSEFHAIQLDQTIFNYQFSGLKKGHSPIDFHFNIETQFKPNSVRLFLDKEELVSLLYDQKLNKEEQDAIVSKAIKLIFEQIKQKAG